MDYELDRTQAAFVEGIRANLKALTAERAALLDTSKPARRARLMRDNLGRLGSAGILRDLFVSGEAGLLGCYLASEEISRACPATCLSARASVFLCAGALALHGTQAQREAYLPGLLSGRTVGAFAYSEERSGSDLGAIGAEAGIKGGALVIDGVKDMVVNAPMADVLVVFARLRGPGGMDPVASLFIVERGTKGLELGPPVETLGLRGAPMGRVKMEACETAGVLGGEPGRGMEQLEGLLSMGAVGIAGLCVGMAETCMEISTERARTRTASGRPIGMYQEIGFKLADMFALVDLSRMLALRAAWSFDAGESDAGVRAACAKLFASEACSKTVNWGMQIFAGHGYLAGSPMERLYRDARFGEICEGTSEILREAIAASELDRFAACA
jgi:alkylation response protein AidB-like acyl-CoA dehydrogenase